MIKIKGLDELQRNLRNLADRAHRLGGQHKVRFDDLFPTDFIRRFTDFLTLEESSTNPERIIRVYPFDLTWEGHEFLAKISADGVWPKLKQAIGSKGGSVAFGVLNELATKLALAAAGLP